MNTTHSGDQPITRDALRAELGSLELRLIERFATSARVAAIEDRLLSKEAVKEMIGDALRASDARGWTSRERLMAIGVFLVTVATFAMSAWAAMT